MDLYPEDDIEEKTYPIYNFAKDILDKLGDRYNSEGISFKDFALEQLGIKLCSNIAKLPNVLSLKYPEDKTKLINTATDIYCLIAIMEHERKENGNEKLYGR